MRKNAARLLGLFLVFLLAGMQLATAQTVTGQGTPKSNHFRGTVIDENDEPLPGVTVVVANKPSVIAITDANGNFTILYPGSTCRLKFSYIGMKTQEVRFTAGKDVTVRMEPDATSLGEVVANGIYTRNIESFTGSVSTFKGEELKNIAPQGIIKSLAILDPSIVLTDNLEFGSDPNRLADISINGKMNVQELSSEYETDPNRPLFILDGFESNLQTISDLNMDRIESISILKDASATAIYGSKAANGVIVVETKKPSAGRLRLTYNGSLTVAWADLSDYNLMNAAEKLKYELLTGVYDHLNSDGSTLGVGPDGLPISESKRAQYMERLRLVQSGHNTYWMNEPLRTAFTQNHNVYMEGGDAAFRYGAGLSYGKTEGVMKGSDRDVINGNIMLQYRVDNFSFSNQTTITHTSSNNETVPFSRFSQMNPFYEKVNSEGDVTKYVYKDETDIVWNPLWDLRQNSYSKGEIMGVTDNFQFEWRVSNHLRLRGNAQYSTSKTTNESFVSPNETSQANLDPLKRGKYNNASINNNRWSGRLNATYGVNWGVNTFNAVGGFQAEEDHTKSNAYSAQGYLNDKFSSPNFAVGYPDGGKPTAKDVKSRSVSFYANANYAYDMRYLLDLNITRSGASQFGIDDPFTNTWSVGIGWNAHNEKGFKPNR